MGLGLWGVDAHFAVTLRRASGELAVGLRRAGGVGIGGLTGFCGGAGAGWWGMDGGVVGGLVGGCVEVGLEVGQEVGWEALGFFVGGGADVGGVGEEE